MAQYATNRSRLMRLSWDIQKNSKATRRKALITAWGFFANEKILVQYLTRDLNRGKEIRPRAVNQYSLFRA